MTIYVITENNKKFQFNNISKEKLTLQQKRIKRMFGKNSKLIITE